MYSPVCVALNKKSFTKMTILFLYFGFQFNTRLPALSITASGFQAACALPGASLRRSYPLRLRLSVVTGALRVQILRLFTFIC